MLVTQPVRSQARRRAIILLVVLAMLTLFAIVGVTFVLYSESLATSARIARESETPTDGGVDLTPYMDPYQAMSLVLGQLNYDVNDDATGVYSAMRGHTFARTIFGWNDAPNALNDKAWTGTGRYHANYGLGDEYNLVNYQFFSADGILRDPEHFGSRPNLGANRGPYTGGANVPYTYPDVNNMFLAVLDPDTNTIVCPSFHRPYLFNPNNQLNDPSNPNWTNQTGKYLIMRPRPNENQPSFPYPSDPGGDVKNRKGAPGGNDSIWMDIGMPVLKTPNGKKFKGLVAPLILELDSRINLNVHGNVRGANSTNAGNQHWGTWEVDLSRVLNAQSAATEWQNVFFGYQPMGSAKILGRYESGGLPTATTPPSGNTKLRFYAQVDLNAVNDPGQANAGNPTSPIQLPGSSSAMNSKVVPFQCFPYYPVEGYGNAIPVETTTDGTANGMLNHPMIYNSQRPASGNRRLPSNGMTGAPFSSLMALLRADEPQSAIWKNDPVYQLLQNNLGTARTRNLVTLHSNDLDRPGILPFIWDNSVQATRYAYDPMARYPKGNGQFSYPDPSSQRGNTPQSSEFDPNTWKSTLSTLLKVDLTRFLTSYPAAGANGFMDTNSAQFQAAQGDRQKLAADLFNALQKLTGALDPATAANAGMGYGTTSNEYLALRWLAQLAVNIVDYIDEDDYMTPFNWYGSEWVFGVEAPRLLLNEVYVQIDNDSKDPQLQPAIVNKKATTNYYINVWAELHNPMKPDFFSNNNAVLQNNSTPIYQVVLVANGLRGANGTLSNPANVLGDPDFGNMGPTNVISTCQNFGSGMQQTVATNYGAYSGTPGQNQGFYVLGPQFTFLNDVLDNPNLTTTYQAPELSYPIKIGGMNQPTMQPTVLLRRLANPAMPPQPTAGQANYNPYITIDIAEITGANQTNDAREYDNAGANANVVVTAMRASWGRRQPYTSDNAQFVQQNPTTPAPMQPKHTFYRHNAIESTAPADFSAGGETAGGTTGPGYAFDWLTQLDRQFISPTELLYVSGVKPHELTWKFVQGGKAQQHLAPWMDPNSRLYRLFELVEVKNRAGGVAKDGRNPGKINLNMVWDLETFRAICNRQVGNDFTDAQVDALFNFLKSKRSPTSPAVPAGMGTPVAAISANDQPFWGLGVGPYQAGSIIGTNGGINNQLTDPYTTAGTAPPLPYQQYELLNKLMNSATTRSSVFAVWMTVGYFAADDSVTPPKLGAEIGRRQRFFAIVDRTNYQAYSTTYKPIPQNPPNPPSPSMDVRGILNATNGTNTNTGRTWMVQPGTVLTFDPDTDNEETVVVQPDWSVQFATFFNTQSGNVQFVKQHTGPTVISRGNPGPWTKYDPAKDPAVLYAVILE
jgi:hypothetical protein